MATTKRAPQRRAQDALTRDPALESGIARITVHVGGLTCASDAARLEHLIQPIPGVVAVVVNPITEIAYVTLAPTCTTPESIRRHIDATVYGPVIG